MAKMISLRGYHVAKTRWMHAFVRWECGTFRAHPGAPQLVACFAAPVTGGEEASGL